MSHLSKSQAFEREQRVRRMLGDDKNLSEIAAIIGISRQALWQFAARRGLLPGDEQGRYQAAMDARNAKRRARRAEALVGKDK